MSAVSDIENHLKETVLALLPTVKPMPYMYLQDLNDRLADHAYAIKVGKASTTSGSNNSLTFNHEFTIDLCKRWSPKKPAGDKDASDKAIDLYGEAETLYKTLARRTFGLASCHVLLISPIDVSEPTIDNDNNLVTVTLTLIVKYRVAT